MENSYFGEEMIIKILRDLEMPDDGEAAKLYPQLEPVRFQNSAQVFEHEPIYDPSDLLQAVTQVKLDSYKFDQILWLEKIRTDEVVGNCRNLITNDQLGNWLPNGNALLPKTFRLVIDESDHDSTMRTITYLEQLALRSFINEDCTIILHINGLGGAIEGVFTQVLRLRNLPCRILVNCHLLSSASIFYTFFNNNVEYYSPHPPILNYKSEGDILWQNFTQMYGLHMNLFTGHPKALLISKIFSLVFSTYNVKEKEQIHSDQYLTLHISKL